MSDLLTFLWRAWRVEDMVGVFRRLRSSCHVVMSTHVVNSLIDDVNPVTTSPGWASVLREQVGHDGLFLTDALSMMDEYGNHA